MANPQTEKGYVRIANDLWNEILRRDFSKRQQNLILFIWRLSYGTGQVDCQVDKFNKFELTGMYKGDIKKELKYLRECSVLNWDEKTMIFSINKNYKLWQISPNKNWDNDKFNGLIHHNISRKKVSKTLTKKKQQVSKTLTFKSKKVSKTLTTRLVKHLPRHGLILSGTRSSNALKTLLKTLKIKDNINNNINPFTFYEQHISPLSPFVVDQIKDWGTFFPDEVIIFSMKLAVESNKRSMGYCNTILNNWKNEGVKTLADAERANQEFKNRFANVRPFVKKESKNKTGSYSHIF